MLICLSTDPPSVSTNITVCHVHPQHRHPTFSVCPAYPHVLWMIPWNLLSALCTHIPLGDCLACLPTVSFESLHIFYCLSCLPTYHSEYYLSASRFLWVIWHFVLSALSTHRSLQFLFDLSANSFLRVTALILQFTLSTDISLQFYLSRLPIVSSKSWHIFYCLSCLPTYHSSYCPLSHGIYFTVCPVYPRITPVTV